MRLRDPPHYDRSTSISKMNWKCFLVGLALVFPASLLSVEGRYFREETPPVREDDFLSRLFEIFQKQREVKNFNSQGEEDGPPLQKKFDTDANPVENAPPADGVPKFVETPAGKTGDSQGAPPAEEPAAAVKATVENGGQREVNLAAQSPQSMAQNQGAQQKGLSGSGMPAAGTVFIMVVAGCTVLAAVGIVGAGVCWYKYHRSAKAASVVDYPAYGVTGPTKDRAPSPGDRKLAHSAQMYHYQHQKQQMMALQSASSGEMKHDGSDDESVEDNDDADYTVYECPGLAPTGEMEVKNPLFRGDDTPSTPANDDSRPPPPEY